MDCRPLGRGARRFSLALALVAAATGCSGAANSVTRDHSLADAIDRCVPHDRIKHERRYYGMTEDEAGRAAQAAGLSVRLVGEGGECFPRTDDFRRERLNLYLDRLGRVAWAGIF